MNEGKLGLSSTDFKLVKGELRSPYNPVSPLHYCLLVHMCGNYVCGMLCGQIKVKSVQMLR